MDEALLYRQPPHSVEAEQAVLGSMLIDSACIPRVVEVLKSDDFYLEHNRVLYDTMYAMFSHSQVIDPVTVLEQMRQNGTYDEKTTRNYVAQLIDITPTSANVQEYVKIVQDKSLLRRIAQTVDDIRGMVERNEGSGQDILEAAEQRIYAIRQGRAARGLIPISQVIQDMYVRLEELASNEDHLPGLSTGLSDLDRAISGLNNSDLNVPVLCQSQLSRANESRADKRPMLSDLRESGAIEQDADIVLFLYRDDYYNPDSEVRNQAECIIAKNRHGETGKVMLQWLPEFTTFSGLDWQHQE